MRQAIAFAAALLAFASTTCGCAANHDSYRLDVGVDLYVDRNYSLAQATQFGHRDIAYIVNVLHMKMISINWDYEIPTNDANEVRPASPITPSIGDISQLTDIAHAYGLGVSYRVLFWVQPYDPLNLIPTRLGVFSNNLLAAEAPALALAQKQGVPEFVVGTERSYIEEKVDWPQFFSAARHYYSGVLSYAMWGGEPGQGGFFWGNGCSMPITVCGITAYPDIDLPVSSSQTQLTKAWESLLRRVPPRVLMRTEVDELGIPAVAGAYGAPWNWKVTGAADDQVQERWFTAACTAAKEAHMRGIYFWNAQLSEDPFSNSPSLVEFEGRPASEEAIKNCAGAP
jgi:hypothetical protein